LWLEYLLPTRVPVLGNLSIWNEGVWYKVYTERGIRMVQEEEMQKIRHRKWENCDDLKTNSSLETSMGVASDRIREGAQHWLETIYLFILIIWTHLYSILVKGKISEYRYVWIFELGFIILRCKICYLIFTTLPEITGFKIFVYLTDMTLRLWIKFPVINALYSLFLDKIVTVVSH